MIQFKSTSADDVRFKEKNEARPPFPPEYYENKKRADLIIRQMTTPPRKKDPS